MNILVKGMKMPLNCIVCPMQFGGMCYVQPPEVDDPRVAHTTDQCVSRASWCPLVEIPDDEESPIITKASPASMGIYKISNEPLVHGAWMKIKDELCECSACCSYWIPSGVRHEYAYCPKCGARMDGEA